MKKIVSVLLVGLMITTIVGCDSAKTSTSEENVNGEQKEEVSIESKKMTARELANRISKSGLTVNNITDLKATGEVNKFTSGVKFTGESGTTLYIYVFDDEDTAVNVQNYWQTDKGEKTYMDHSKLQLFVGDRNLGKGYFDKYKKAIFKY